MKLALSQAGWKWVEAGVAYAWLAITSIFPDWVTG
jgi:hypothetical protein